MNCDVATLHEQGFVLLKRAVAVSDAVLECVRQQVMMRGDAIFNHADGAGTVDAHDEANVLALLATNDGKRLQCPLHARTRMMRDFIAEIKQKLQPIIEPDRTGRRVTQWVALRSLPGCQDQAAHCDYEPATLIQAGNDGVPLAVIVALMPGTKMHVWPRALVSSSTSSLSWTESISKKTLLMEPGDCLVFRGDLVHAGAGYKDAENVRLHAYIDSPSVKRPRDRTWLIGVHASKELKRRILG